MTSIDTKVVKQKLKVGVVSTMEHVTTLTSALKKCGHTLIPLPELGDRYSIPPSCQVIVCRVEGTSHRAVSICLKEARKGNRPVIFRTGTTRIMEKINQVASGEWVQDNLLPYGASRSGIDIEDMTPEQLAKFQEEAEREQENQDAYDAISSLIEKGNVFTPGLITIEPDVAKDVVCSVRYATRDRVKRTALLDGLISISKMRPKVIEEQAKLVGQDHNSSDIWWQSPDGEKGTEKLIHGGMSDDQIQMFVKALSSKVKNLNYTVEEPQTKDADPMPDVSESTPESVQDQVEPIQVPKPLEVTPSNAVKVEHAPAPASFNPDAEKDIHEFLAMIADYMDSYGVQSLPLDLLERVGLGGTVTLNLVHMAGRDGTCCSKKGSRVSFVPGEVTCKNCQSTNEYGYAVKLFAAWSAK